MQCTQSCCSSVAQSCPTLYNPTDCSTSGFLVLHYLSEIALVHWVDDATQPSHPVVPFFSCPQSFPASGSFTPGGKSIGASASVLPMNIQDWFPLALTGLISLQSKGLSRVFSSTSLKASILWHSAFFMVQICMTTGKTIALTIQTFVCKVMSLLFNILPRFVTVFLPRSKNLLISWLHSLSAVILEPTKIKSVTVSIVSPSVCHDVIESDAMILVFWKLSFKSQFFHSQVPTRARPSFPHSQSLPSGILHKSLILIHQRADRKNKNFNTMAHRMKTTITEN